MHKIYKLEKWIWDDSDFDQMGWHDCKIHGFAFYSDDYELVLDMDYLFEWLNPVKPETHFDIRIV